MKIPLKLIAAASLLGFAAAPISASAETNNLIPNWNFSDRTNPLNTWRIDFPYQGSYVKNIGYVKIGDTVRDGDSPAVELDLPKGVAENEGGKIETAFVKIDPGASYHASVDVMTNDLAAKFFVEVYAVDPTEPGPPSLDRIPARDGLPALVKCYPRGLLRPGGAIQELVYRQTGFHRAGQRDHCRQTEPASLRHDQGVRPGGVGGRFRQSLFFEIRPDENQRVNMASQMRRE